MRHLGTRKRLRHLNFIPDNTSSIQIVKHCLTNYLSTDHKICEISLNTNDLSFDPEFDEERGNIIPLSSLSLAINGHEKSIPVERLLRQKMPLIKERNLEMDQVNFVGSTKTDEREIAVWLVS